MIRKIIIAGSGGQGVMLLGKALAVGAMFENKYVTWLPAYGAEVRGGTAHCSVVISDRQIGSPYIDKADILIIMNTPSFLKFAKKIKKGGLIFANRSLINEQALAKTKAILGDFTGIASSLGNTKVANMVALGLFIAQTRILKKETMGKVIREMGRGLPGELMDINIKAFEFGLRLNT